MRGASDWSNAARLLADHAFSLTLDGHAETIQALVRAFPRRVGADDAELALLYATQDIVQGRLDEAAARLEFAEQHATTTPPDRQHRQKVAIASMKLELAMRSGHFDGVVEQVEFLSSPLTARSNEDVALGSDLRAFALLTLGIVPRWNNSAPPRKLSLSCTKARLGMLDDARVTLAGVPAERVHIGEIHNAQAVIHMAESYPTAALSGPDDVLNGRSPVIYDFTRVESHLLAARAHDGLGNHRAAHAVLNSRWRWPNLMG